MLFAPYLFAFGMASVPSAAQPEDWQTLDAAGRAELQDDDIDRHRNDPTFLDGIVVSERRFSENGFDWQLIRFTNATKPDGPLWVIPHDDENAAFDAMVAAVKLHGGVGIAVNTGPASSRRQAGYGRCGVRAADTSACDPNRNFDVSTPAFTQAILGDWQPGRPVIALHTNSHGFGGDGAGGRGDITMLDVRAYARGQIRVRYDGFFGNRSVAILEDPDVFAILPYRADDGVRSGESSCRIGLNKAGVNVWHERVGRSDGSLSNFIALYRPQITYVNFEAEREADLTKAAEAQRLMISAYLGNCALLWNQPVSAPVAKR